MNLKDLMTIRNLIDERINLEQDAATEEQDRYDIAMENFICELMGPFSQLLTKHFPIALSGDETPEMVEKLYDAIRNYLSDWINLNIEDY